MPIENLKYSDITGKAIRCGYSVYNYFSYGYPEIVYKRALRIDFREIKLDFTYEKEIDIYYKNENIYSRRHDFLLADKVLVEVKAFKEIDAGDVNQILNYLKVFKIEIGLLFNFGAKEFYFKRFIRKDS